MAIIDFDELVAVLMSRPEYLQKWELGAPANQALYIQFTKGEVKGGVTSEVVELVSGLELVLDRDSNGKVVGIEFI